MEAERTFWEKATILHAEYHRPADRKVRTRHSRDHYDLCMIADSTHGRKALGNLSLLERVVQLKRTYFRSGWANYDTMIPGSFHLVPPDHRIAGLRTDYQQMRDMFYETPPSFDELLIRLKQLEDQINQAL